MDPQKRTWKTFLNTFVHISPIYCSDMAQQSDLKRMNGVKSEKIMLIGIRRHPKKGGQQHENHHVQAPISPLLNRIHKEMKTWLKKGVCEIENYTRTPEFSYCYPFPFLLSCLYKKQSSCGSPTTVDGKKRSRQACRPLVEVVWNGAWLAAATNRHVWQEPGPEALEEPAPPSFAEEIFLQCAPMSSIYPASISPLMMIYYKAMICNFSIQANISTTKQGNPAQNE